MSSSNLPATYEYKTVLVHRVLVTFCVQDSRKAHETHTRYAQDRARRPSHNTTTLKPLKHATHAHVTRSRESIERAPSGRNFSVFSQLLANQYSPQYADASLGWNQNSRHFRCSPATMLRSAPGDIKVSPTSPIGMPHGPQRTRRTATHSMCSLTQPLTTARSERLFSRTSVLSPFCLQLADPFR